MRRGEVRPVVTTLPSDSPSFRPVTCLRLPPRRWLAIALPSALVLGASMACGQALDGIGLPCARFDDCPRGLFCDVHEGRGSCQMPHSHEDDAQTGDESGTDSSSADDNAAHIMTSSR